MENDLECHVRFRAHELWEANGKPNGNSFWDLAEAEVKRGRAKGFDRSPDLDARVDLAESLVTPSHAPAS